MFQCLNIKSQVTMPHETTKINQNVLKSRSYKTKFSFYPNWSGLLPPHKVRRTETKGRRRGREESISHPLKTERIRYSTPDSINIRRKSSSFVIQTYRRLFSASKSSSEGICCEERLGEEASSEEGDELAKFSRVRKPGEN